MTRVVDQHHAEVPLTLEGAPPKVLGVLDQGALWANLAVSLLGFSGALALVNAAQGAPLSLAAALTATVVGSLIGTVMVALSAIPGTQTGRPSMVLLRGLFGAKVSYVPTVLNVVQMLGWGAFELWVIAIGCQAIFGDAVPYAVWVIAAGVLTTVLTIWPLGAIRVLRRYVTIAVIIALAYYAWRFLGQAPPQSGGSWTGFGPAVDYVIALSVSWVPLAADFARHSRSSGAAFAGVVGGYTLAQVACLGLGIYAVALTGSGDVFPTFVAVPLGALFFGILILRETDQSFANVYSTTMSLQNFLPRVDRRVLSVIVGVITTLIAIWVSADTYASFLSVIGAVFVPMFAVLAVDYFVLGGRARWNTDEDAPSRWSMLIPWALGFVAYWLTTSAATVAGWDSFWTGVRDAIGFERQPWMNGALGAFVVAALVTLLIGLLRGSRR
ncbi:purine-cytosine permease family protein [Nonomuraea sp. NPDC050663]|uniref:purine-cytosine permease family protein n=1 Tax=Nonomuraea sp. NPDC050663 TaxID=3364370 RepID=UPI0037B99F3B